MKLFTLTLVSSLAATQVLAQMNDPAMQEIQSYCQSMVQPGTDEGEAKEIVNACVNEQRMYLADASDMTPDSDAGYDNYRYEADDSSQNMEQPDCYQLADEQVQAQLESDPEAVIDYETLVSDCQNAY
ncbi:MAG: hypothetical protein R3183_06760 [Oleiphilaceae bacterium]|nr:hypothetical protein [Oleiphilaceae bacterium]